MSSPPTGDTATGAEEFLLASPPSASKDSDAEDSLRGSSSETKGSLLASSPSSGVGSVCSVPKKQQLCNKKTPLAHYLY